MIFEMSFPLALGTLTRLCKDRQKSCDCEHFINETMDSSGVVPSTDAGRRTWDKEEAERKYAERMTREKEEAKEAKLKKSGMGKLGPPKSGSSDSVQARTEAVIKVEELKGKRELVAGTLGRGNKGKSAGFYCETCDLTFKDSLSYLDHINSSGHYRRLGISGKVERATLEQVRDRLAWLKQRKIEMEKEKGRPLDLVKRVAEARRLEEEEKQRRRDKKKAKRRVKRQHDLGASDVEMNDQSD
jgi:U4/U6.U5 tri-snRNP component SNU23